MNERKRPEDFLTPYLGPIFLRLRKGRMTQEELAKKVKIHVTTLGKIESGVGRVRPDLVRSICHILGVDSEEVLGEALESLMREYKRKPSREKETVRTQDEEPLKFWEDQVREKHDERIRAERELRETFFSWAREVVKEAK